MYGVKIVRDDDMPADAEWMFVKTTDGDTLLFFSEAAAGCERVLAEAWAAYRCMEQKNAALAEAVSAAHEQPDQQAD